MSKLFFTKRIRKQGLQKIITVPTDMPEFQYGDLVKVVLIKKGEKVRQ